MATEKPKSDFEPHEQGQKVASVAEQQKSMSRLALPKLTLD